MAGMTIVSRTSSNLIDPTEHVILTPHEISERQYGSKMVLVVEQMQMLTVWTTKACLLIMYNRLTYVAPDSSCNASSNTSQHESEPEPGRQDCRRIRRLWLRPHGDSLHGSLVSPLQSILGCTSYKQYVTEHNSPIIFACRVHIGMQMLTEV